MFKKKLLSFLILIIFCFSLGIFAVVNSVNAQNGLEETILKSDELEKVAGDVYDENPLGTPVNSMQDIIILVINTVLGLLGVIFLIIIIYAGFLWMTAGGNDDQVGKAKKWLVNGIIGVVIIVGAYAISYFVLNAILPK